MKHWLCGVQETACGIELDRDLGHGLWTIKDAPLTVQVDVYGAGLTCPVCIQRRAERIGRVR